MKTLILFLALSTQTIAADLYLRNNSGHDLRVKVRNTYENVKINRVLKTKLDNVFKNKVEVFYQNKVVTSTEISPSNRDSKLRVYRKDNSWLIGPNKR